MKVLVVEDDRDLADQITDALRQAGYTVETAHDGETGEFLGATETVAAAVLDLGLPGIDGIEVLKRWRGAGLAFPVLILTARDAWSDKVAGFRAGADDYVLKRAFEAKLLRYLMLHKGRVVSRTELSEHMYDRDSDRDFRSMEVVIGRLRKKIGETRVETRRGEGYRLLPGDPA